MTADINIHIIIIHLVCAVAALVMTVAVASWMTRRRNLPPYPVWPLPIVGHIPYIRNRPRETMKEWRKKVGDIFTVYSGTTLTIVINGYDNIKDALVKQADYFSDRPKNILNNLIKDGNKGIINSSGAAWKEQRNVTMSIFKNCGMVKSALAEKIQQEVSYYLDEIGKAEGRPQEVRVVTNVAVSNIICSIIIGKRFEYEDPYFKKLIRILHHQVTLTRILSCWISFPWLRYIPGDLFGIKQIVKNYKDLIEHFCEPFINKFSKKLEDGEDDDDSFITHYLKEMKQKQESGTPTTMEVAQLAKVIQHLFMAGTETTSTTLMWFMLYMLHHPNVQQKIFQEISEVVGTDRAVTLQDKPQMNYLNAAIMEAQRLASIAPFSVYHVCTKKVTIKGYTIPANTIVIPVLDSILHDENTWGDAMNYRPERFLDNEGKLLYPEEFAPYSLGKRACMGEPLAKMELFLFLSALIQRFELLPANLNVLPPLEDVSGVSCPPKPYEIRFVERSKAQD